MAEQQVYSYLDSQIYLGVITMWCRKKNADFNIIIAS